MSARTATAPPQQSLPVTTQSLASSHEVKSGSGSVMHAPSESASTQVKMTLTLQPYASQAPSRRRGAYIDRSWHPPSVSGPTRDVRLILGGIAVGLAAFSGLGIVGGFAILWMGMSGSHSETESAVFTGTCVALATLALSLPGLVVGIVALRRPVVAPIGTTVGIAGIVTTSLAAILAVGMVGFAFLALVVNSAAVVH